VLDNGAFSLWKQGGEEPDWSEYADFVAEWMYHPAFDWALIPDTITGDEAENDALLAGWPHGVSGVPVWHFHESLDRLGRLCEEWPRVAIGSSGEWAVPGTDKWWLRMSAVMERVCDIGRPRTKLHGLRMLDPDIFRKLPLASADSTNAAQNATLLGRFGTYKPPTRWQGAAAIADRIEAYQSSPIWVHMSHSQPLFWEGD
jgi:hypothetical protein